MRGLFVTLEMGAILAWFCGAAAAQAQQWDYPARAAGWLTARSEGKLKLSGELRGRYERRTWQSFGASPDLDTALIRSRLSVSYRPAAWLKFSGAVQDSRAPGYGVNAPSSARDQVDLLEGYFELFPDRKKGFGLTAGRMMLNYGETRLIASPQWGNVTRSFDHARAYWRHPRAQVEFLWLSPTKARLGEFNKPVLGERVWGTYNSFPNLFGKQLVEAYILRHDQNFPGGFTGGNKAAGTNRLGVTTFGGRVTGPLPRAAKYGIEAAVQTGKVGAARHRAGAWASWISRRWTAGKMPFDLLGEYKFASGTKNPQDTSRVGAFDPLFPSGHDKFGHMDLFGWRNIHNARGLATLGLTKAFSVNVMYDSWWLASVRDALYNSSGKAVGRVAAGLVGRHVGQEVDLFGNYKYQRFTFGAGFGRLFKGAYIRNATPGVEPLYAYVFHTYAF
jgi:hypothetical protein